MFKKPKQEYTAKFKELSVRRVRGDQGIAAVARDLGLIEQMLRNWVKAAKAAKMNAPLAKAISTEQMGLARVCAENARLRMEIEILRKATAYFAKDVLRRAPGSTRSANTCRCC